MAKGRTSMRYLGGLRGAGFLHCRGETLAPADYDFDGYFVPPGNVSGSGEIRTRPEILRKVFGRRDLQLVTADGRRLSFRFTEKKLGSGGDAAHVDVTDGLPTAEEWRS